MGIVTTVPCRSYSDQEFDHCPACNDAALDAVAQAAMYVLGHAAPSLAAQDPESSPIEMAYRLRVRLFDADSRRIAEDEFDTDQTIAAIDADSDWPRETTDWGIPYGVDERDPGSMRLDDFQTLMDLVDLAPAAAGIGTAGARGGINGRLFGFERPIGRFEVEVASGG
jgi:hypothetical protein